LPSVEAPEWQQIPGYTLVALGCSLILVGILDDNCVSRALSAGPLRYLGKISFGIYVYHVLCLAAGKKIAGAFAAGSWWVATLASAALTVAVAALSYQFFEKRFLVIKERFAVVKSRPS
ncbi:MAG: acyltransferase family protein, partial [Opitutaceae bacterium]